MAEINLELKFTGKLANENKIEMYDAWQALAGFHRSLAITTNLIITGELISRSQSLQHAEIFLKPIEIGSWKSVVAITAGTTALLTASTDSLGGHLVFSAYHYVIKKATGIDVDYDDGALQEQLRRRKTTTGKAINIERLDKVVERCEGSVLKMHRPIAISGSAEKGEIYCYGPRLIAPIKLAEINRSTHSYVANPTQSSSPQLLRVKISSYDIRTFSGRAHVYGIKDRVLVFELVNCCKEPKQIELIIESMKIHANDSNDDASFIFFKCQGIETIDGQLRNLLVEEVTTSEN